MTFCFLCNVSHLETTFHCFLCNAPHVALPPEPPPVLEPGKREELRAKFYKAADEFVASKEDPNDKLFKWADKAAATYFQAISHTGVERVPDTLASIGGKNGTPYALVCSPSCPFKEEETK